MEKSALVYIVLTLVTVGFGFCVRNSAYTAGYLSGRRMSGAPVGYDRQQARNLVAETAVFCLLAGVSACRIAGGASQYTGSGWQSEFYQCYQHQFGTEWYNTPCE